MIFINNNNKLSHLSPDDTYILADFDGTITRNTRDSSWTSIFKNPNVKDDFVQECVRIFNYYHKYEIDESIPMEHKMKIMTEWYKKNIETLIRFGITEEMINYSANNESIMCFRNGAESFLSDMNSKGVPIVIISAGVGNIIQQFLINSNCNYPNIYICSNFLEYENGTIKGVRDNNLIHPLNKNEVSLPQHIQEKVNNRNNVILLGDSIPDIKMANPKKNIHMIGFLDEEVEERLSDFKDHYDIVCTDNTSFDELQNKLNIFIKRDVEKR